jgi:phosphatidylinositol kinase/protein kinase (PI-3  family)
MENLLNTLSKELRSKIDDAKVMFVGIDENNELVCRSEYDMDATAYEAIEAELRANASKINYVSNDSYISNEAVAKAYKDHLNNDWPINVVELHSIQQLPSGHGHWKFKVTWLLDDQILVIIKKTSNMPLLDAWRGGGELTPKGNYDSWDDVVSGILDLIDPESAIDEMLFQE